MRAAWGAAAAWAAASCLGAAGLATELRRELAANAYTPLKLGTTAPEGWMKAQLGAESAGLVGQKAMGDEDKVDASAWLGGKGTNDLAEPFVYWLNGAWPLAVLLEDQALASAIDGYLEYILDRADENDGWLGPLVDGNPWSTFRFVTAMTTYIDAKPNARVCSALFRFASRLLHHLEVHPLKESLWAYVRWQELLEGYHYLLENESSKCSGAHVTSAQRNTVWKLLEEAARTGFQWPKWFESTSQNPFTSARPRGWFPDNTDDSFTICRDSWLPHVDRQWTHGVNVGHGLMIWALMYRQTGNKTWLERGDAFWKRIMKLHGQATGALSADECLSGRTPERGTETCTVVELMNSAATMFMASGKTEYMDRVEALAYNALPGAFFNGTMWTLNYFQQVNKIDAMDGAPRCESGTTYCFGMVYECCITNHAQGWVRFAARQFMTTPTGKLALLHYFASTTRSAVHLAGGTHIKHLMVDTNYPFSEIIRVKVSDASQGFGLELRIPQWCHEASVRVGNATALRAPPGAMFTVNLEAGDSEVLLSLPMRVRVERRDPYQLHPPPAPPLNTMTANVWHGPLMYAIPRGYVRDSRRNRIEIPGLLPEGQVHSWDHYLLGVGEWRHALIIDDESRPDESFKFIDRARSLSPAPDGQGPFAEALVPSALRARVVALTPEAWDIKANDVGGPNGKARTCLRGTSSIDDYLTGWAGIPPQSPVPSKFFAAKPITVTLLPYGATNLRVAEFPTTTSPSGDHIASRW
ncbi:Hypothetical Protein FCC1311_076962 [Hondaea fermentalgiana]|uniref:Uncharacterized protein n=1 Tax=Hondaea fermentalgiana TaxID=2315210 RepID=A0A2R5GKN7_9STRA|nr:Hypothetical Protein FCC1311_076962 [Hondaea fermentalgiana]|eukprot:GBG31472.1 Hypothetical Protein FCC1311_076962 [Hondaea fermentalgiana]